MNWFPFECLSLCCWHNILPVWTGFPLQNHSTFMVLSFTGIKVASKWADWPSTRLSRLRSGFTNSGFWAQRTSCSCCLTCWLEYSNSWIWCKLSGCCDCNIKPLLAVNNYFVIVLAVFGNYLIRLICIDTSVPVTVILNVESASPWLFVAFTM